MSELLSAASLLMTVIAILYSLWHNDLQSGLAIKRGRPADNLPSEKRIRGLITSKALPLAAMAWATSLVFMPKVISLAVATIKQWLGLENRSYEYDPVNTSFCLVVAFSLILSAYTTAMLVDLTKLWLKLRKKN